MRREEDLDRFYGLLDELGTRNGKRMLVDCEVTMDWPRQGVYFFFEKGEMRQNNEQMRVVRVGTHALTPCSRSTLWNRLSQDRGNLSGAYPGGGNHRASVFRKHLGYALNKKLDYKSSTWGTGSSTNAPIRKAEYPLEIRVSEYIRSMPFLWVRAEDEPGPHSIRAYIEKNTIALLSNFKKNALDPASAQWLGQYHPNPYIRESGQWNVSHVDKGYDPNFLDCFQKLIRDS